MLESLKEAVCQANRELLENGLVGVRQGGASGLDRKRGYVVINPEGIPFGDITPETLVVVDLKGRAVQGSLKPSVDTPVHLALYRAWPGIAGIAHTHSPAATAFAQAGREIPCLGAIHAGTFSGSIRITEALTPAQADEGFAAGTAVSILSRMGGTPPLDMPGILVARHGVFTWGEEVRDAVSCASLLEMVARIALDTYHLNPGAEAIPESMLEKLGHRAWQ